MSWKEKLSLGFFLCNLAFYAVYDVVCIVRDGFHGTAIFLTVLLGLQVLLAFICFLITDNVQNFNQTYQKINPYVQAMRHFYQLCSVGLTLTVLLGSLLTGKSGGEVVSVTLLSLLLTGLALYLDVRTIVRELHRKRMEKSKPYLDYIPGANENERTRKK